MTLPNKLNNFIRKCPVANQIAQTIEIVQPPRFDVLKDRFQRW